MVLLHWEMVSPSIVNHQIFSAFSGFYILPLLDPIGRDRNYFSICSYPWMGEFPLIWLDIHSTCTVNININYTFKVEGTKRVCSIGPAGLSQPTKVRLASCPYQEPFPNLISWILELLPSVGGMACMHGVQEKGKVREGDRQDQQGGFFSPLGLAPKSGHVREC